MTPSYPIVFEREASGAVTAYVPGLPVYAAADTPLEAEEAIRGLLVTYLEDLQERGAGLPEPTVAVKVARVTGTERKASVVIVGPGALLGATRSRKKAAAARRNGALGGRPRAKKRR